MKTAVDRVRGQGARRQRALCGDDRALPVRAGLLQRRQRAGRRASSRRTCRTAGAELWRDGRRAALRHLAALNAWLAERCRRPVWSEIAAPGVAGRSRVADVLQHEQPQLMPMPSPSTATSRSPARVSSTSLVSVERNRYCGALRLRQPGGQRAPYPSGSTSSPTASGCAPRAQLRAGADLLRLAALHSAGRAQARGPAQRCAVRRPARAAAAPAGAACCATPAATA